MLIQVLLGASKHALMHQLQLLGGSGIYVSPVYDGAARRIELEDEHGPVSFLRTSTT